MIRIGSDTDIGINRNSSDWLGMNSYPILSPGEKYVFLFENFFSLEEGTKVDRKLLRRHEFVNQLVCCS